MEAASNIVLAGLIGIGIARSRTPEMHMAEAAAQSLRGVYRIIDVDTLPENEQNLKAIVHAAEVTGFNGLNVTYPFKMEVIPLLDQLSPNAALSARSTPSCSGMESALATTPTCGDLPRVFART